MKIVLKILKIMAFMIGSYLIIAISMLVLRPIGFVLTHDPQWGPLEMLLPLNQVEIIESTHSRYLNPIEYDASFVIKLIEPQAFDDFRKKLVKICPDFENPSSMAMMSKETIDSDELIPQELKEEFYGMSNAGAPNSYIWEYSSVHIGYMLSKNKQYLYIEYYQGSPP